MSATLRTSLTEALSLWGRYDQHPYKRDIAKTAYQLAIKQFGKPWMIYEINSSQYVAVCWAGAALYFQPGFIQCKIALWKGWVAKKGYFYYYFPDYYQRTGRVLSEEGSCPNCPGLVLPLNTECPYCGTLILT